jgi:hypothetical protein
MSHANNPLRVCFERDHLLRTTGIALFIGTWLTLFNHATALFGLHLSLWVRVVLNYLTPLMVANWGLLSRQTSGTDA